MTRKKDIVIKKIIQKIDNITSQIKKDSKRIKIILITVMVVGLFANAYVYFNVSYSVDSLISINQVVDIEHKISIGRFFQPINMYFRGYIVQPWLLGVLSLFYISLATYIILDFFELKDRLLVIAIASLFSSNIVITYANAMYIHDVDSFMLAFVFSTLSAYIFKKYNNKKCGLVMSGLCALVSLGLYQAFIQVTIVMIMIDMIIATINKKEIKYVISEIIRACITFMFTLFVYFIVYKIIMDITQINYQDAYNSITVVSSFSLWDVLYNFTASMGHFVFFFIIPTKYNNIVSCIISLSMIAVGICIYLKIIKDKQYSWIRKFICIIITMLLPIGATIVAIGSGVRHQLMYMSFYFIYLFILCLINKTILSDDHKKILNYIFSVSVGFIVFYQVVFANQYYLKRDLSFRAMESLLTRLTTQIEMIEGYVIGETKVVFVGDFECSQVADTNAFDSIANEEEFQTYGYLLDPEFTRVPSLYYSYILNYPISIETYDVQSSDVSYDIVSGLDLYPSTKSFYYIEETNSLIIKFCEVEN